MVGARRVGRLPALEAGYRLRVPGTALWFNVEPPAWEAVRLALVAAGAEQARDGLQGEELYQVPSLSVSYQGGSGRVQAIVEAEGDLRVAACLSALRAGLEPPAAEASPVWLWSPTSFAVAGVQASPAQRLIRAARWIVPLQTAESALCGVRELLSSLAAQVRVRLLIEDACILEIETRRAGLDGGDPHTRAAALEALLERLGPPERAEHVTFAS